jgi:hypothetical protein
LVYPNWHEEPYKKWLKHPRVHVLTEIPQGQCAFIPPDHFKGPVQHKTQNTAKWGVYLILVANSQGITKWYNHATLTTQWAEYFKDTTPPALHEPHKLTNIAQVKGLARACRVHTQCPEFVALPQAPQPTDIPTPTPPVIPQWHTDLLRWPQRAYVYTDGSKVDKNDKEHGGKIPRIGAAYYDDTVDLMEDDGLQHIEPTAFGANNTVTRAELVAIYTAIYKLQY